VATYGEKISSARIKKNLSSEELAIQLQISDMAVYDLEHYNDELELFLDINAVCKLCEILDMDKNQFLFEDEIISFHNIDTIDKFSAFVTSYLRQNNLDWEALENKIGWEFIAFINDRDKIRNLPILAFKEMANVFSLDWQALVSLYL